MWTNFLLRFFLAELRLKCLTRYDTVKNNQDRIYDQQRRKYLDQVRWQTIFDASKDQMFARLYVSNKKYNVENKQDFGYIFLTFIPI